ncbi:MAG: M23 family metallopeptidase [Gemmatimonadaceae bacterium]
MAEPLHFERSVGDTLRAFAPVPIDSTRGISLLFACTGGDSTSIRVPVAKATYQLERLTVDPRFSATPDSMLAERLRRESARAAAVADASHETPRLWIRGFVPPRPSRITSTFGKGRQFNGVITSRHMGTDFAGQTGAPVHAANRGVVRLVDAFYLGGNVVYVDHGAGITTAYLHLSQTLVTVGDTVDSGTLIGRVGATGRVTGPHLHLIMRYGRTSLDPLSLFALTRAVTPARPTTKLPAAP